MSELTKITRRGFLRVTALMAGAAALAACAPKATPAPAGAPAPKAAEQPAAAPASKEKVEVTFQARGDEAIFKVFRDLKADFESRVDGITIKIDEAPTEWWQKLQVAVAGGTAPDSCFSAAGSVQQGAFIGLFNAMDDYLDADPRYNYDDFYPMSLYSGEYKGEYYHLPYDGGTVVLNYNIDLFEEEGLPLPDPKVPLTWDEYLELGLKLTKDMDGRKPGESGFDPSRIKQYGCNPGTGYYFQWIRWNGGELFAEEDREKRENCTIDSPEAIEAVQFLADFGAKHHCSPSPAFEQSSPINLFNGNLAMDFQGVWNNVRQRQVEFNWDVAPLLQGRARRPLAWWSGLSLLTDGKNKAEGYEWLWYCTSVDGQSIVSKLGQAVPHLKALANSPVFLDPNTKPDNDQVYLDELNHPDISIHAGIWHYQAGLNTIIAAEMGPVWRGEKTAAEVLPGVAAKLTHLAKTGEVT
jgi:multiple sugar transport system substrate-binding protein